MDFWRDMTTITEDEIAKLRKLEASGKGPGEQHETGSSGAQQRLNAGQQDVSPGEPGNGCSPGTAALPACRALAFAQGKQSQWVLCSATLHQAVVLAWAGGGGRDSGGTREPGSMLSDLSYRRAP